MDERGKAFTSENLTGKIYVANFFFTRCGTICPKITSQMSRVTDAFIQDKDIHFISLSVDPKYDNPEKLASYAKKFDADTARWTFLTGDKKNIYPLILKGFHVPLADASEYDAAIKNPDETFIHSERLVLVDKSGVIRGFYDGTDKKEVDRLIVEIKVLKTIYSTEN
jgi:protein SCO1/2